jgi:dTDP-4-amino-4,6-dideoxygalactose transaminase
LYISALRLRNHGALKKYDHEFSGRNSRLDTIQAGILNIKLKHYNKVILKRNKLADIYFNKLGNNKNLELFKLNKTNLAVYHQFVIRTNKRNQLRKFLEKNNIETMVHYPYMLNELKFFKNNKKLKNSNKLGNHILSLPISEEHSESEIKFVAAKINQFFV